MKFELTEDAKSELAHARDAYETEREGLGREFLLEMRELAREIAKRPQRFPFYPRTLARRALGKRFPYMLVFVVVGDVARIVSVAHQHQAPAYWKDRL
jgi:plasmid stabilization system protein ParE